MRWKKPALLKGRHDFPLKIRNRSFTARKSTAFYVIYSVCISAYRFFGDIILINDQKNNVIQVKIRVYRLRVLNASAPEFINKGNAD